MVISVIFFRFSLKLLSRISEKVRKYVFLYGKKTNKTKLEISYFWENQFYRKVIAFDKIGGNYALSANSTKICLLGYFCMHNSYLREKSSKSYDFREKCKRIEKWIIILVLSVNFFEIFTETLEQNIRNSEKICFLDGKEDK